MDLVGPSFEESKRLVAHDVAAKFFHRIVEGARARQVMRTRMTSKAPFASRSDARDERRRRRRGAVVRTRRRLRRSDEAEPAPKAPAQKSAAATNVRDNHDRRAAADFVARCYGTPNV